MKNLTNNIKRIFSAGKSILFKFLKNIGIVTSETTSKIIISLMTFLFLVCYFILEGVLAFTERSSYSY